MTGWSRKSKAQACTLLDLHHTSWQKSGTMINSAAPEKRRQMSQDSKRLHTRLRASEIRFFSTCLLLPLVQGVLIVPEFRTWREKSWNITSLRGELLRWTGTLLRVLSADKITNWSKDVRVSFVFPSVSLIAIQENLVLSPSFKPHGQGFAQIRKLTFFCYRRERS